MMRASAEDGDDRPGFTSARPWGRQARVVGTPAPVRVTRVQEKLEDEGGFGSERYLRLRKL